MVASSDADDFNVSGSGSATRTAVSDADLNTGRYVSAGATAYAGISVRVDADTDVFESNGSVRRGVFARLVDINNWVMAVLENGSSFQTLKVYKRLAGTVTTLGSITLGVSPTSNHSIRFTVLPNGQWFATGWAAGQTEPSALLSGFDPDLVSSGTLDDGKIGIYDGYVETEAHTNTYDNFLANPVQADAALFASQSLELRHDQAIREDSAGAIWSTVSDYEGKYLLIPPAGPEDRQTRIIVKASRNLPENGADSGIDDISARLTYTPRYLQIPG